jgi:GMP synthase-like glutamine amidotransferase
MIWFVVTDSAENYEQYIDKFGRHKLTLERIANDCCLLLHYKQVTPGLLKEARPWAICHSGGSAPYSTYDVMEDKPYGECILKWDIPQIGFCGGHQVLATHFGSTIGPMHPVQGGEPDHNPNYMPGIYKEWGIYPVQIMRRDALFKDLGNTLLVQEYHGWEVTSLASDLTLLASSQHCRVQAFVHKDRPLYGTQFHPEQSPEHYPDGCKVLTNFFNLARAYAA